MKKQIILTVAALAGLGLAANAQARLSLSDGAFAVIAGGAKLVVDNPAPNAIQTLGTGGKIISEGESSGVQWNIGAATGTYVFPFTTMPISQGGDEVSISLSIAITTAGSADGSLSVSTYKTNNQNQPYPTGISDLYSSTQGGDGSLYAIDRFWVINAQSYTTQPAVTLSIGYNDGPAEMGGANMMAEPTLRAQRWDDIDNNWGGGQFGTVDAIDNTVDGIAVPSGSFHSVWTLVSSTSPLPVQLVAFDARADEQRARLEWEVANPADIARYQVERSADGQSFTGIGTVEGAALRGYIFYDASPLEGINYYRIRMIEQDGSVALSGVKPVLFGRGGQQSLLVYPVPAKDVLHIRLSRAPGADARIRILDIAGKLVMEVPCGGTDIQADVQPLAAGAYLLELTDAGTAIRYRIEKL